jgi:hypothetical protein
MPKTWENRPHIPLTALLLVLIVAFPAMEYNGVARCLINTGIVGGTLLTLWRVHARSTHLVVLTVFGLVALAAQYTWELRLFGGIPAAGLVCGLSETAFLIGAAIVMTLYMMQDAHATVDELFAAGAAFLLMALAWACTYWLMAYFDADAFNIAQAGHEGRSTIFDFLYLSMTTLTTTGYGDILPKSSWARSVVMLEQLTGVMYVTLVISRLAGFAGRGSDARG